jgi:hypothetical protein
MLVFLFVGQATNNNGKKDAGSGIPNIAIKLPGADLFIHLFGTGCGARHRADGNFMCG